MNWNFLISFLKKQRQRNIISSARYMNILSVVSIGLVSLWSPFSESETTIPS
jgi:hypothetical protein